MTQRQKLAEFVDLGIGGSVYERLSFADKNSYVPMIVSERRQALAGAIGVSLGDVEELIDKAQENQSAHAALVLALREF